VGRHIVGSVSELLPGTRRRVLVGGRALAVFNVDGTFYALRDICPHRGAMLSAGTVVGSLTAPCAGDYRYDESRMLVKCPWHGWEFDLATGQSWCEPERERVRPYAVTVESGEQLAAAETATAERAPGPYVAETVRISVEDDYVVVEI
jgi:3-phenylpropionate/trans-cinnamate dioxygenase ferredoxin subunit